METPRETSPYNYFQERYRDDGWRLLVVVMMLNQTNGKQVERVHKRFFERYPTPFHAKLSDPEEMAEILRPLGFYNRRSLAIKNMSSMFIHRKWEEPSELYGCGEYAQQSWDIVVNGILPESPDDVSDKELKRYVEWARSRG